MPANRADAAALKKEGNDAMKRGAYKAAVEAYTAAIDLWMENEDRAILYTLTALRQGSRCQARRRRR